MKIYARPLAFCGLLVAFCLPALAHNLDKKSLGELKAAFRTFPTVHSGHAPINAPLPSFVVPTPDGQGISKAYFKGKIGLLVLADTQCPVVQALEQRLLVLSKRYSSRGLRVAYIFSKRGEKPIQILRFMEDHEISFPALLDRDQKLLKQLNGRCAGEVYLTDKSGILRYHGRVDDSPFDPKGAKSRDLENAVVALTQGKKVARAETIATGCALPRS